MACAQKKGFIDSDDDELPSLVDRIQNFKRSESILPCKEIFDSESDDDADFSNLIENICKTPQIANKNGTSNKENVSENLKSSCKTFKMPQSQVKSQNTAIPAVSSPSDDEDEFFKFSERIRNTPYSQNRNPTGRDPVSLMSDIPEKKKLFSGSSLTENKSKSSHGQIKTPLTQINSNRNGTSNKENVVSEFLKPLDRNVNTNKLHVKSQNTVVSAVSSDSEDEDGFFKFSERIRHTPHSQNRNPVGRDACSIVSDFPEKKKLFSVSSLEVRKSESCSHGLIKITPLTQFNNHQSARSAASPAVYLSSESDDESEFFKFSEKIRNTPRSQNVILHSGAITSDSEEVVFLKLSDKLHQLRTPRNSVDANSPLSDFPKEKTVSPTLNTLERNNSDGEPIPDSLKLVQSANVKEYEILFPSKSETPESFLRNREKYTHQLFDFFNKKIFDSQYYTKIIESKRKRFRPTLRLISTI